MLSGKLADPSSPESKFVPEISRTIKPGSNGTIPLNSSLSVK
jgi:hypothetical protein